MTQVMSKEKNWWDDTAGFFTDIIGNVTEAAGEYASGWLNDEIGAVSTPEKAVELPQGANADVSNAPDALFGLSTTQLAIGGVVAFGAVFLLLRKR